MDSPVRIQQKKNDYLRHKFFRTLNRRKKRQLQQQIEAPEKELRRRLRLKRYDPGKNNSMDYEHRGTIYDDELKNQGITHVAELPEVVVKGRDYTKPYESAYEGNPKLTSEILRFLPGIGDVLDVADIAKDAYNGNYLSAGIGAGMLALPNFIEKPLKAVRKFLKRTDFPSAIEYAYGRNPRLAKIGTMDDYENYIKTIFPKSKIQDIQYHMGPKGLQELKPSTGDVWNTNPEARGIYVTPERSYAENIRKFTTDRLEKPSMFTYIKRNVIPGGWKIPNEQFTDVYPVVVDTRNPLQTRGTWTWGIGDDKYNSLMSQYDGIVNDGPKWWQNINKMPETIIPTTGQTHILGTAADAERFSDYMLSNKITSYSKGKDSGIHIKPENRGKFNALKKRTGKTTEELTHSKNPLTRKRAIFAQNARKWNHKK